ncbi:MAG: histidine phosphatase family protein [Coriobacteriales bacterium]|nr:histidine phosphatase family protein [Coriobacteriales bacterium]
MTTHLLIARHPETEANVAVRFIGRGNAPYTAFGERQVDGIVAAIVRFDADAVWSSPLARAAVPAAEAARRLGVEHIVDDRLIELDFGDAEGMTWEEIEGAGLAFDYRSFTSPVAPNGESRADIEARATRIADEMLERGGRIAVVTHGGPMRAMIVHLLGLARTDVWAFHLKTGQLAYVDVADDGRGWLEEFCPALRLDDEGSERP